MAVPAQPLPGYFYDELSKIRVLEPDTAQTTDELREECKDFVDSKLHTPYITVNTVFLESSCSNVLFVYDRDWGISEPSGQFHWHG